MIFPSVSLISTYAPPIGPVSTGIWRGQYLLRNLLINIVLIGAVYIQCVERYRRLEVGEVGDKALTIMIKFVVAGRNLCKTGCKQQRASALTYFSYFYPPHMRVS